MHLYRSTRRPSAESAGLQGGPGVPGKLRWGARLREIFPTAVGVTWALVMASLLVVGASDRRPEFASRHECGTDPQDFLRAGEMLDTTSLRFIVHAHCSNARFLSDERIALPYVGTNVDVETQKLSIGGETYYRIVSVGGLATP